MSSSLHPARAVTVLGSQVLVGASPALHGAVAAARQAAGALLLLGEPGTGRETLARGVHYERSPDAPFLVFAPAAVPEHLAARELFGVHPTLRPGDPPPRRGLLEMAGAGTLFVPDADCLPPELQLRLAEAACTRRARREGGAEPVRLACRVVLASATDALHPELCGAATTVRLPALRERGGDVELLAQLFLHLAADRGGVAAKRLTPGALAALRAHAWPGNVGELRRVVERAAARAEGPEVTAEHLGLAPAAAPAAGIQVPAAGKPLSRIEAEAVALTLALTRGNQSAAARVLGVSRPTLARMLRRHGLSPRAAATSPEPLPLARA